MCLYVRDGRLGGTFCIAGTCEADLSDVALMGLSDARGCNNGVNSN